MPSGVFLLGFRNGAGKVKFHTPLLTDEDTKTYYFAPTEVWGSVKIAAGVLRDMSKSPRFQPPAGCQIWYRESKSDTYYVFPEDVNPRECYMRAAKWVCL